jgi:biotin carboxyl carrier protein
MMPQIEDPRDETTWSVEFSNHSGRLELKSLRQERESNEKSGPTEKRDQAEQTERIGGAGTTPEYQFEPSEDPHQIWVHGPDGRELAHCIRIDSVWWVHHSGSTQRFFPAEAARRTAARADAGGLTAPMPGKILAVMVAVGDDVAAGQPLLVLEAMKMEHQIAAPRAGRVTSLPYTVGEQVQQGQTLAEIESAE